jgi:hypothetical protein
MRRVIVYRGWVRAPWLLVVVGALLMASLAGCGEDATSASTETGVRADINPDFELVVWVSTVGLAQLDPDVWSVRFEEICTSRTESSGTELEALASRYIAEDAGLSVRSSGDLPTVSEGVESLLLIAGSVCAR